MSRSTGRKLIKLAKSGKDIDQALTAYIESTQPIVDGELDVGIPATIRTIRNRFNLGQTLHQDLAVSLDLINTWYFKARK